MGFLTWLDKKISGNKGEEAPAPSRNPQGFAFSDEDRAKSLLTRRHNAKMRQIQEQRKEIERELEYEEAKDKVIELQQELDKYREAEEETEDTDEYGDPVDKMFMSFLDMLKQGQGIDPQRSSGTPSASVSLTDSQIMEYLKKIPASMISKARAFDDNTLTSIILREMPGLDSDTIARTIEIIRAEE